MKLAEYLSSNGITVAEFGRQVGVSAGAVSRYAAGLRFPETDILIRIRAATGGAVTADDFLPAAEPLEARA